MTRDGFIRMSIAALAMSVAGSGLPGAAAAGGWIFTGSMQGTRYGHAATLLRDGRVLVSGGHGAAGATSAELYNRDTGSFAKTGSMSEERSGHSLTLLPDGRVLAVAGTANGTSAELYDPATRKWTMTGSLHDRRAGHAAVLLGDGTVLVTGGSDDLTQTPVSTSELYDPATGAWTHLGSTADSVSLTSLTLLPDGKVFGFNGTDAEVFDPATRQWSGAASCPNAFKGFTATLLGDGTVLAAAGQAVVYDQAEGTWAGTGSMVTARNGHAATLLPDGRVLATGGWNGTDEKGYNLVETEIFTPADGTWAAADAMNDRRFQHVAVLMANGMVLAAGGIAKNPDNTVLQSKSAEIYDTGAPAGCRVCQGDGTCVDLKCGFDCGSRQGCDGKGACVASPPCSFDAGTPDAATDSGGGDTATAPAAGCSCASLGL